MRLNKRQTAELDRLYAKAKVLTPEAVVRESRKRSSALRSLFHWDDDAKAAQIGRIAIARDVIASVRVERSNSKTQTFDVRMYHGSGKGYRSIDDVITTEQLRSRLIEDALRDLERFAARYETIADLSGIVRGVRSVIRKHRKTETP